MKQGHGAACHIHLNTIVIKAWIHLSNVPRDNSSFEGIPLSTYF